MVLAIGTDEERVMVAVAGSGGCDGYRRRCDDDVTQP
jgi:hypothetical protein